MHKMIPCFVRTNRVHIRPLSCLRSSSRSRLPPWQPLLPPFFSCVTCNRASHTDLFWPVKAGLGLELFFGVPWF
jgi:hypothetical protein